jgi:hypothetical protein
MKYALIQTNSSDVENVFDYAHEVFTELPILHPDLMSKIIEVDNSVQEGDIIED